MSGGNSHAGANPVSVSIENILPSQDFLGGQNIMSLVLSVVVIYDTMVDNT